MKSAVKRNLSEKSDATYTMTIIERNFNGTVYRVTVKEEERLVEEEQPTLEEVRDVVEDLECYQVTGYSNIIPDIVLLYRI